MASTSSPALINTNQSPPDQDQQPYPHQTALLNLIKKLTRYKPLSDHESSIISLSDSAGFKDNGSPTDNLILDGFLKNNGGYLDDSDSSDSEDSEENPPSEFNQNKHTIHVLAKKYQNEADSNHPTYNSLIGFTLSRKIFKFNLNHSDHHHPLISTIINKQSDDQNFSKINRVDDFLSTTSLHNDHHPNYHTSHSTRPLNHQQRKLDRMAVSPPIQFIRNRTHKMENCQDRSDQTKDSSPIQFIRSRNDQIETNSPQKLGEIDPSSHHQHKSRHYRDIKHQQTKVEDWDLNLKYIQSSTFPTKNTIIDHDHSHCNSRHHVSLGYSYTAKNNLHLKKYKSPFRNLVLGQDDLLRSN